MKFQHSLVGILFILTACTSGAPSKATEDELRNEQQDTQGMVTLVQNESYEVLLRLQPQAPQTGESSKLLFEVRRDGDLSDVYEDERMLHVIVASENREDFLHSISAVEEKPGLYSVPHTFTQPGRYRIWVEVDDTTASERHGQNADLIVYIDVTVEGRSLPPSGEETASDAGGEMITLEDSEFVAEREEHLRWQVRKDGGALPLFPEEPGIYVVVGPNLSFFQHGHADSPIDGTLVDVPVSFPDPGTYLFWSETYAKMGEGYGSVTDRFLLTVR